LQDINLINNLFIITGQSLIYFDERKIKKILDNKSSILVIPPYTKNKIKCKNFFEINLESVEERSPAYVVNNHLKNILIKESYYVYYTEIICNSNYIPLIVNKNKEILMAEIQRYSNEGLILFTTLYLGNLTAITNISDLKNLLNGIVKYVNSRMKSDSTKPRARIEKTNNIWKTKHFENIYKLTLLTLKIILDENGRRIGIKKIFEILKRKFNIYLDKNDMKNLIFYLKEKKIIDDNMCINENRLLKIIEDKRLSPYLRRLNERHFSN